MKTLGLMIGVAALLFGAVQAGDAVTGDLAKLEGTWVFVKKVEDNPGGPTLGTSSAGIAFYGNKVTFHSKLKGGDKWSPEGPLSFSIDPSKKPKTIDIKMAGAEKGMELVFTGIYHLEGDELKIAFKRGDGGSFILPPGRPADFDGKDKTTTTIFRREYATVPQKLTPEEEKVVAVAQDYLKKRKMTWETPMEVKRPPNRVNVPDWKKYVEEEKNIWKVVYETPKTELKALGPRTLFVNMRTNEVTPSARK
jgi:uncharacterized protein (TIGR03067 family)